MIFFVGLHQPADAAHFKHSFISVNRVRGRKKPITSDVWILDSGAFTEIATYGAYRHTPEHYAREVNRLSRINPTLQAAVSQDYMCEPWIVKKTGLTVITHQQLTIERYDALLELIDGVYLMPVLQGYEVQDYLHHLNMYGPRIRYGSYVGVGSVCKRNGDPIQVKNILRAIKHARPDILLHGFGLKETALKDPELCALLATADSMAWSFSARKQGRNANDWREAAHFVCRVECLLRNDVDSTHRR